MKERLVAVLDIDESHLDGLVVGNVVRLNVHRIEGLFYISEIGQPKFVAGVMCRKLTFTEVSENDVVEFQDDVPYRFVDDDILDAHIIE